MTERSALPLGVANRVLCGDPQVWQLVALFGTAAVRWVKCPLRDSRTEGTSATTSFVSGAKVAARASTQDAKTATRNISGAPRGDDSTPLTPASLRSRHP